MISRAQTGPAGLARGINCWQRIACKLFESCRRTCSLPLPGTSPTMRSTEVAAVGVQRREDKVARFSGGDRHLHRLQCAFADEETSVFAESGAQGFLNCFVPVRSR